MVTAQMGMFVDPLPCSQTVQELCASLFSNWDVSAMLIQHKSTGMYQWQAKEKAVDKKEEANVEM